MTDQEANQGESLVDFIRCVAAISACTIDMTIKNSPAGTLPDKRNRKSIERSKSIVQPSLAALESIAPFLKEFLVQHLPREDFIGGKTKSDIPHSGSTGN